MEPERFALARLERLEVSQAAVVLVTPNRQIGGVAGRTDRFREFAGVSVGA